MVMVGHLTVPTMDDVPASVSRKIVTNLLRYDLGFRGVIVTDGLQMQALAQYTDGEKAVLALAAGNDMLLEISDVPGTVAAIEKGARRRDALARGTRRERAAYFAAQARARHCGHAGKRLISHNILRKLCYSH